MKMVKYLKVLVLSILLLVTGCKDQGHIPQAKVTEIGIVQTLQPGTLNGWEEHTGIIPSAAEYPVIEDLNKSIILELDPWGSNSLKAGEDIELAVRNESDETIVYDVDWNVVILQWNEQKKEWFRVDNKVYYIPAMATPPFEIGPKGTFAINFVPLEIFPQLVGDQDTYDLQVLVLGHVKSEDNTMVRDVAAQLFIQLTK